MRILIGLDMKSKKYDLYSVMKNNDYIILSDGEYYIIGAEEHMVEDFIRLYALTKYREHQTIGFSGWYSDEGIVYEPPPPPPPPPLTHKERMAKEKREAEETEERKRKNALASWYRDVSLAAQKKIF